jgi:hypothetical protein
MSARKDELYIMTLKIGKTLSGELGGHFALSSLTRQQMSRERAFWSHNVVGKLQDHLTKLNACTRLTLMVILLKSCFAADTCDRVTGAEPLCRRSLPVID